MHEQSMTVLYLEQLHPNLTLDSILLLAQKFNFKIDLNFKYEKSITMVALKNKTRSILTSF